MPSSTTTALSSSCFPEKPATCLGDGAYDRFATAGSSFNWASDVDCEFYSEPNSRDTDEDDDEEEDTDLSRSDIRASILSVDRFFASSIRTISESGFSLSAMSEEDAEDEDEEDNPSLATTDSDPTDVRSLVDRIFAGGCAPSRYKVASVPSLGAIEEEDESQLDDDVVQTDSLGSGSASTALSAVESEHSDDVRSSTFSSLHFSGASSDLTLDEDERNLADDLDSDWVLVEAGDGEAIEPGTMPLAHSCEAREWRWRRVIRNFFAL